MTVLTPANLAPSFYTQFMRMTYLDGTGQASTLGFQAFVQIAPSTTLNPPSVNQHRGRHSMDADCDLEHEPGE